MPLRGALFRLRRCSAVDPDRVGADILSCSAADALNVSPADTDGLLCGPCLVATEGAVEEEDGVLVRCLGPIWAPGPEFVADVEIEEEEGAGDGYTRPTGRGIAEAVSDRAKRRGGRRLPRRPGLGDAPLPELLLVALAPALEPHTSDEPGPL